KNVVVPVDGSNEPLDGARGGSDFPLHTAAGVEHDAHADGQIVGLGKVSNCLRLPVFLDDEVVLRQVRNVMAAVIGDRRDDVDQSNVHFQLRGDNGNSQQNDD